MQKIHSLGCACAVDCGINPRNVFGYSIGTWGNAAMNVTIRDLSTDELECVVGGDAPRGAGCATEEGVRGVEGRVWGLVGVHIFVRLLGQWTARCKRKTFSVVRPFQHRAHEAYGRRPFQGARP